MSGRSLKLRLAEDVRGFTQWEPGALFRWLLLEILCLEISSSPITRGKHPQSSRELYSFTFAASRVHVTLGNRGSWPQSWIIHAFKNRDGTEERRISRLHFKPLPKPDLHAAKYNTRLSEKWLNPIVFRGLVLEEQYVVQDSCGWFCFPSKQREGSSERSSRSSGVLLWRIVDVERLLAESQFLQCKRSERGAQGNQRLYPKQACTLNPWAVLLGKNLMWTPRKYELLHPYLKKWKK